LYGEPYYIKALRLREGTHLSPQNPPLDITYQNIKYAFYQVCFESPDAL
jgi:hypothetical protein